MNLPTDRIHCINWGYGWLLLPWFGGWLCLCESSHRKRLRIAPKGKFHNCRATGVY